MFEGNVYLNWGNALEVNLVSAGVPIPLTGITRFQLVEKNGQWLLDSDLIDGFIWSEGSTILKLKLGHESIPKGTYICNLFVHDTFNPDGFFWGRMKLNFIDLSD